MTILSETCLLALEVEGQEESEGEGLPQQTEYVKGVEETTALIISGGIKEIIVGG